MQTQDQSTAQQRKSSAILDAARVHFATHGFEATKLSDIATDSGVAVGTIYLRYRSKAELLAGVLDRVENSFCDAMDTPDIWALHFPLRFEAIFSAILSTAGQEKDLPKLMALAAYASNSVANKQLMLLKITEHLEDGIVRGELRSDLDTPLVAQMALGLVDGAMRELMSNPERSSDETSSHISDACSRWLTNPR